MIIKDNKDIIARLNKAEGQIRGIKDMINDCRKCDDIIIQLSAVSSALRVAAREVLNRHISTCVVDSIKNGKDDSIIENLLVAIDMFSKIK